MKKRNLLMTTMATLSASGVLFAASSTAMAATTHEIAQNDTLWSLSQKYGVSVKALKKVNKLSSDLIIAGQTLKVPSKAEAKLATATTHKVVKGDTLWSIAKKYGVGPVVADESSVTVALIDPMGYDAVDSISL